MRDLSTAKHWCLAKSSFLFFSILDKTEIKCFFPSKGSSEKRFNSTMVQSKHIECYALAKISLWFQFHNGSIKTKKLFSS